MICYLILSKVSEDIELNFNNHELVHDAPNNSDIESKFIEGAFTYNEYALLYATDVNEHYRCKIIIQKVQESYLPNQKNITNNITI